MFHAQRRLAIESSGTPGSEESKAENGQNVTPIESCVQNDSDHSGILGLSNHTSYIVIKISKRLDFVTKNRYLQIDLTITKYCYSEVSIIRCMCTISNSVK
jgi:hypothetical protein